jgi:hypothetical protein
MSLDPHIFGEAVAGFEREKRAAPYKDYDPDRSWGQWFEGSTPTHDRQGFARNLPTMRKDPVSGRQVAIDIPEKVTTTGALLNNINSGVDSVSMSPGAFTGGTGKPTPGVAPDTAAAKSFYGAPIRYLTDWHNKSQQTPTHDQYGFARNLPTTRRDPQTGQQVPIQLPEPRHTGKDFVEHTAEGMARRIPLIGNEAVDAMQEINKVQKEHPQEFAQQMANPPKPSSGLGSWAGSFSKPLGAYADVLDRWYNPATAQKITEKGETDLMHAGQNAMNTGITAASLAALPAGAWRWLGTGARSLAGLGGLGLGAYNVADANGVVPQSMSMRTPASTTPTTPDSGYPSAWQTAGLLGLGGLGAYGLYSMLAPRIEAARRKKKRRPVYA